jgi:flagellar basal body rod protein FlgG
MNVVSFSMTTLPKGLGVSPSHLSLLAFSNLQNASERLLRDTLKSGTDDRIQQFTDSFAELRQRFAEGSNINMSNLVRNLESGIVGPQDLGKVSCRNIDLPRGN